MWRRLQGSGEGKVPVVRGRSVVVGMEQGSSSYSTETTRQTTTKQLNESLFELYKPRGAPSVQIIFFHGFQLGEGSAPHLDTWRSGDDSTVWPQTWLVDEFPGAHVFTVAYKAELRRDSRGGKYDLYLIVENIISDLLQEKIGQNSRCPIVFVGHSFGGLVMKDLCLQAHVRNTAKHETFLSAVKGFFFYSTPHDGIPSLGNLTRVLSDSPLLAYVETLSKHTSRLNNEFESLAKRYGWQIAGVGESIPTKLNRFPAFVVVPEASARYGDFNLVPDADHITVCKPMKKTSRSFNKLTYFIHYLPTSSEQMARPENYQHLPRSFVGMDDTLDTLKIKLHEASSLGLAGMGGIGKSTLVRALFNVVESQYEYTCFIKDVKNVTKSEDIKDAIVLNLHHWGKKMGKEEAKNLWVLQGKRLLLILDDVASEEKDLEIMAMLQDTIRLDKGSRLVATSRDGELLKRCLEDVQTLGVLGVYSARQLFVCYAFPKGGGSFRQAPPSFEGYVNDIVEMCGQLPLALEVMGKHLHGKGEAVWRETQIALRKGSTIPGMQEKLMSSLQLSYDGLDGEEKQMFLDASSVFYHKSLDLAKMVWTGTMKETCWQRLLDLSLVWEEKYRNGHTYVGMHEQLQTLAKQIASTPGGDGRRIWGFLNAWELLFGNGSPSDDLKDIVAFMLQSYDITPDVRERLMALGHERIGRSHFLDGLKKRVVCWSGGLTSTDDESDTDGDTEWVRMDRVCIPKSTLMKLGDLRYLELVEVDFDNTRATELPSTIVWFRWFNSRCTNFPFNPASHRRMISLNLSAVKLCILPSNFGQLSGLKILTIECMLKSLPDSFGGMSCLVELTFRHCHFVNLPETFGKLENLKRLKFSFTYKLKALPQSFGELSQLEALEFSSCAQLEALPNSFGRLRNLKQLNFSDAKLKRLPQAFGELLELESLVLDGCNELEAFPDSFGRLQNLKQLWVRNARMLKALPQSIGDLSQLELFELEGCRELEALPDSFWRMRNLKQLGIWDAEKWKALPQSLGDLSELESLRLYCWFELEALPDSLGRLSKLREFRIDSLPKLTRLPETFGDLASLQDLQIRSCEALSTLPDSCGRLAMLEKLHLEQCNSLLALPDSLGRLPMLQRVTIKKCTALEKVPESLRIHSIP